MNEERLISGVCPKCGQKLQIPQGLDRFSCLYCGTRLDLTELLPAPTCCTTVSLEAAQEAYDYVAAHLPECVTAYPNAFRHLTKKEFEPYFQDYLAACRPVFRQIPDAAQALPQKGPEAALTALADGLLTQLEAWIVRGRHGITGRDALLDDAKYTICLLLIPGIRQLGYPICEDFCRILQAQWLARYPKKVFQLTTYEDISRGFRQKKLCFITTAACDYYGKPDNCPELTAFRAFRDGWLQAQPDGPQLIRRYYDIAPGIVTAIALWDNPAAVYPAIWTQYLLPCREALDRGDNTACKAIYTQMVQDLSNTYLGLST